MVTSVPWQLGSAAARGAEEAAAHGAEEAAVTVVSGDAPDLEGPAAAGVSGGPAEPDSVAAGALTARDPLG